jgi:hypothetical protein
VRQDAALEEGVELVLDEPGQFGAGAGLGVGGDEAGCVLLHEAIQRGLLGTVALEVDRGAIGRPLRLPADVCPPLWGLIQLTVFALNRQLCDNAIRMTYVSSGSLFTVDRLLSV